MLNSRGMALLITMLDAGKVKISSNDRDLIWLDNDAKREFFDAISEIKSGGC